VADLAAGEVDISFGGDQRGSIGMPAAYCGVVGMKPTFGLVSHFAVGFAAEPSVDHVCSMARTARDVAPALQAVAGYDDYDPASTVASRRASTRCLIWMAGERIW
jgi:amidase